MALNSLTLPYSSLMLVSVCPYPFLLFQLSADCWNVEVSIVILGFVLGQQTSLFFSDEGDNSSEGAQSFLCLLGVPRRIRFQFLEESIQWP